MEVAKERAEIGGRPGYTITSGDVTKFKTGYENNLCRGGLKFRGNTPLGIVREEKYGTLWERARVIRSRGREPRLV